MPNYRFLFFNFFISVVDIRKTDRLNTFIFTKKKKTEPQKIKIQAVD